MKKRLLIMMLALGLTMLLVACGDNSEITDAPDVDRETTTQDADEGRVEDDENGSDTEQAPVVDTPLESIDIDDRSSYFITIDGVRFDIGVTMYDIVNATGLEFINFDPEAYAKLDQFMPMYLGVGDERLFSVRLFTPESEYVQMQHVPIREFMFDAHSLKNSDLSITVMGVFVLGVTSKQNVINALGEPPPRTEDTAHLFGNVWVSANGNYFIDASFDELVTDAPDTLSSMSIWFAFGALR